MEDKYLVFQILSHIKKIKLLSLVGKLNKQFSYWIIKALFKEKDDVSRDYQKEFLSRIFLFPKKNILTILKNWDGHEYNALTAFIIEELKYLPVDNNFEWEVFTAYANGMGLNNDTFKTLLNEGLTKISPKLSLLLPHQIHYLNHYLIRNLAHHRESFETYKTLNLLIPSLLNNLQLKKLITPLTTVTFSFNNTEDIQELQVETLTALTKRLPSTERLYIITPILTALENKILFNQKIALEVAEILLPLLNKQQYSSFIYPLIHLLLSEANFLHGLALKILTEIIMRLSPKQCTRLLIKPLFYISMVRNFNLPFVRFHEIKKLISFFHQESCEEYILDISRLLFSVPPQTYQALLKITAALILIISEQAYQQFIKTIINTLIMTKDKVHGLAFKTILILLVQLPETKHEVLIAAMSSVLFMHPKTWKNHEGIFNALSAFICHLSEEKCQYFIEPILNAFNATDPPLPLMALNAMTIVCPQLPQKKREVFITPTLKTLYTMDWEISRKALQAITILIPSLSEDQRQQFIKPLLEAFELSYPYPQEAEINAITTLIAYLPKNSCATLIRPLIDTFESADTDTRQKLLNPILVLTHKLSEVSYNKKNTSFSEIQIKALISVLHYQEKRKQRGAYHTRGGAFFDFFNARSKTAKLNATKTILHQMLTHTFNKKTLPAAAKNGELKQIVRRIAYQHPEKKCKRHSP